ncbi:FAD/NAD(P)-binding protein [Rathayibacter toxicus]|uniref:FAD/NAD(P)-binding protein n=1 Tax=Rathayibacter toxicus TaxID=145458 RepID=UPI001C04653F|nr:FAD/NAD(P)-binding protein [Rathayibacter toxicus]QWL30282.1 hypothetical protein E2R34_05665 [Rathayibacter toxicus]
MTSTITWRVAIVGAGPRATYTLERLSASIYRIPDEARLEIHVFDQSGYFGAGTIHAWDQPECSLMNRTADQVGLGPILPSGEFETFVDQRVGLAWSIGYGRLASCRKCRLSATGHHVPRMDVH